MIYDWHLTLQLKSFYGERYTCKIKSIQLQHYYTILNIPNNKITNVNYLFEMSHI